MSGQHMVQRVPSTSHSQITQQGAPGAGLIYDSHSLFSQLQQDQSAAQMGGQGPHQDSTLAQRVTVNQPPSI